jgi:threonine dehydratase
MITLPELESATQLVYQVMPPTPQYSWPLLNQRYGREIWVKHENHTPAGAFKVRGGIVLMHHLKREQPQLKGIISATRGNHGQSLALSAKRHGFACVIVVPHGNSAEKNAAMRAQGAELVEHGQDFDEARAHAAALAQERGLEFINSFRRELVMGVGTYALEFLRNAPSLEAVYVPIGMGSGICGLISARNALNLKTKIIGVVSEHFPAWQRAFASGQPGSSGPAHTIADGVATRTVYAESFAVVQAGAEDVIAVSEDQIKAAMRAYYTDTHNLAEGAGAVPLAGAAKDLARTTGRIGVILCGGNVDAEVFAKVIAGVAGA